MAKLPTIPNEIGSYFHCARCLAEKPQGISPSDWAQLECGWTPKGFQVWCKRHEINIIHVDFEGVKHPVVSMASIAKEQGDKS